MDRKASSTQHGRIDPFPTGSRDATRHTLPPSVVFTRYYCEFRAPLGGTIAAPTPSVAENIWIDATDRSEMTAPVLGLAGRSELANAVPASPTATAHETSATAAIAGDRRIRSLVLQALMATPRSASATRASDSPACVRTRAVRPI